MGTHGQPLLFPFATIENDLTTERSLTSEWPWLRHCPRHLPHLAEATTLRSGSLGRLPPLGQAVLHVRGHRAQLSNVLWSPRSFNCSPRPHLQQATCPAGQRKRGPRGVKALAFPRVLAAHYDASPVSRFLPAPSRSIRTCSNFPLLVQTDLLRPPFLLHTTLPRSLSPRHPNSLTPTSSPSPPREQTSTHGPLPTGPLPAWEAGCETGVRGPEGL